MKLQDIKKEYFDKSGDSLSEESFNRGFDAGLNYARNPHLAPLEYLKEHYVLKFRSENPFNFKMASDDEIQDYLERMMFYAISCIKVVYENPIYEEK